MTEYKVGQIVDKFIGHHEGVMFDIADDGATILVFFDSPSEDEIRQFKSGNKFKIGFMRMKTFIMILLKVGDLNWMDAPYNPHMSKNLTYLTIPKDNQGVAVTMMLIDSKTGEIKTMRLLGLSNKFTKSLFSTVCEIKTEDFDKTMYIADMQYVFSHFTEEIVSACENFCEI